MVNFFGHILLIGLYSFEHYSQVKAIGDTTAAATGEDVEDVGTKAAKTDDTFTPIGNFIIIILNTMLVLLVL